MAQTAAIARNAQLTRLPKGQAFAIQRGQDPLPYHIKILTDRGPVAVRAADMHAAARQAPGASSYVTAKTIDDVAPRVERVRETADPAVLGLVNRLIRIGTVMPVTVDDGTVTCVELFVGSKQLETSGISLADIFVYHGYNGLADELKLEEGAKLPRIFPPPPGMDKALTCTNHRYVSALLDYLNKSMRFNNLRLLTHEEADVFFASLHTATREVRRKCVWLGGGSQSEPLPLYNLRNRSFVDAQAPAMADVRNSGARIVLAMDGAAEGIA